MVIERITMLDMHPQRHGRRKLPNLPCTPLDPWVGRDPTALANQPRLAGAAYPWRSLGVPPTATG